MIACIVSGRAATGERANRVARPLPVAHVDDHWDLGAAALSNCDSMSLCWMANVCVCTWGRLTQQSSRALRWVAARRGEWLGRARVCDLTTV
jgi:hypothetical protein